MTDNKIQHKKYPKIFKLCLRVLILLSLIGILLVAGINFWVVQTAKPLIQTIDIAEQSNTTETPDCIIILGAGLRNGQPSPMLKDRLDKGIECYKRGLAPKLLMSGDHGKSNYNEVAAMKKYAMDAGIPSCDIFMDHAGFSTYESVVRARKIFDVESAIIVTQEYHMYRAVFIAQNTGLHCLGVPAQNISYGGQAKRTIREYAARCKDVFTVLLDTAPTYGGNSISIKGNGDVTND